MLAYKNLSDLQLMSLLQKDDHAAYTEIYERYFGLLYLHAKKKVRNKEDARDIIQEVFISIWNRRAYIEAQSEIIPYLYTVLKNKIINWIARQDVNSRFVSHFQNFYRDETCITDHKVRESQLAAIIDKEIGELPPRMREIFELSRKAHLSHKEIAQKLDISEQTVKTQVKYALRILKNNLGLMVYLYMYFTLK